MRRELAFLEDILDCIDCVESYLAGVNEEAFQASRLLQDAVVRNLQIIGEAVKNVTEETKQKHPHIDWRNIARTRDRLVHHYFRVDLQIVWDIATNELSPLKTAVTELLKELDT
jgi:uncharacterized protein with HEPN domain